MDITLNIIAVVCIAIINIASILFILLVSYNFRYTVTTRTDFVTAIAGVSAAKSMYAWSRLLFILYLVTMFSVMISLDVYYVLYFFLS